MICNKRKSPKIMKSKDDDMLQYFIDYSDQKDTDTFIVDFINKFSEKKQYLVVIDTDKFYKKNGKEAKEEIGKWKEEFQKRDLVFDELRNNSYMELYHDGLTKRIRICADLGKESEMEGILEVYK